MGSTSTVESYVDRRSVGKSVTSGEKDIVFMRPWSGETGREVEGTSGASTKAASSHATSERCTQSD